MEKNYFYYIVKDMPENSVKRACYVVREYIRNIQVSEINGNKVLNENNNCAVKYEEYKEALNILLGFSYENSDEKTTFDLFHCESDCYNNNGCFGFCKGEFQLTSKVNSKNKQLCKYYKDSGYV